MRAEVQGYRGVGAWAIASITAIVAAAILAISASTADAAMDRPFERGFALSADGAQAMSAAFDSDENLLVVEGLGNTGITRVDTTGAPVPFTATGSNIKGNKLTGTPTASFYFENFTATTIGIDRSGGPRDGYIYVPQSAAVYVFDSTGAYKGAIATMYTCGAAVSQADGSLYLSEQGTNVKRYTPVGLNPANDTLHSTLSLGVNGACSIALNSDDDVYVSGGLFSGPNLTRYDAAEFGKATPVGTVLAPQRARQIAVDPVSGEVFGNVSDRIRRFDAANVELFPTVAVTDISNSFGLVLADDKRLYATETDGNISVYGPDDINVPLGVTGAASAVTENTASLAGEVKPDGAGDITSCEFIYGLDKGYASGSAPCVPAASPGTPITADTPVTAALTGLLPDRTYRYRLVVGNANGKGTGRDKTFKTVAALFGVTTGAATAIKKDSASVGGSYTGIGDPVTYYFEYGTTTKYGSTFPAPPGNSAGSGTGTVNVPPVTITGLMADTVYNYRIVAVNKFGPAYGPNQSFKTATAVTDLVAKPATNITSESAELNASFTADSYDTDYYFEYGPTPNYGSLVPLPPGNNAGTGSGTLNVEPVAIDGLEQGGRYYYRVVAKNSRGTTASAGTSLRTADAPVVRSFSAENVKATSADLHAVINPQLGDTSYRFEYGTTLAMGTSIPANDEAIGGGANDKTVEVHLDNLDPGSTYYFQVVAYNEFGSVESGPQSFSFYPAKCPNAQVRQETNSDHAPDCRAFEIASAAYGGGVTIFPSGGPTNPYATNPSRIAYTAGFGTIPGAGDPINTMGDLYVAVRSETGWTTEYVGLPATKTASMGGPPEDSKSELVFQRPDRTQFGTQANPSLSRIVSYDNGYPNSFSLTGSNAPYIFDSETNEVVDRWPTNLPDVPGGEEFVGTQKASADLTHFVFSSNVVFADGGVAGAPVAPEYSSEPHDVYIAVGPASVYDNDTSAGTVRLASLTEEGTHFAGVPLAISDDGSRILMAEGGKAQAGLPAPMYVRVDGETTYEIADAEPVKYVGTTANGRTVYFTSADPLTPDDLDTSVDLFAWSEDSPDQVTRVSFGAGGTPGNSDACAVAWVQKCGVKTVSFSEYGELRGGKGGNKISDVTIASGNGDIYFQSPEQLNGAKGELGQVNLYVYRNGGVHYVATMANQPLCTKLGSTTCSSDPVARMQVTPSGSHMAFITNSQVMAYDNAGKGQMYVFDTDNMRLACASCKRNGEPPTDDVYGSQNGLFLTNDGRAFFSTIDAVVRQDTNGVLDVYEYTGGRPQLITTGIGIGSGTKFAGFTGTYAAAGLVSVSADGTDAYFATFDRLVTQDHNGEQLKIYNARTNGGFPADVVPPRCEAADECHGPGSVPPAAIVRGTGADLGVGGNASPAKAPNRKAARKKAARKKAARKKAARKKAARKKAARKKAARKRAAMKASAGADRRVRP